MIDLQRTLSHIQRCAEVPSFSTFEERLHPYVESVMHMIPGASKIDLEGNTLIYHLSGKSTPRPLLFCAHLDKINHFGEGWKEELPFSKHPSYIEGQLDDTIGLGVLLSIAETSVTADWPECYLAFTEMEESYGIKHHTDWLKGKGKNVTHGMGAEKVARFLVEEAIEPEAMITIDTSPLFKGETGVAVYSNFWELYKLDPVQELVDATESIVKELMEYDSHLKRANNTNDYMILGKMVNRNALEPVPSVALEPAIFPYHQKNERVFLSDIERTLHIVTSFLSKRG